MSKTWYPYADLVICNAKIYTVDLTIPEIQNGKYDFTIIQNGFVAVKDGKISERGTHREMMKHDGPYRRLIEERESEE